MNRVGLPRWLGTGLLLALALHILPAQAGEEVKAAVIGHPAVADDTLSNQDVQSAFLGRKTQWSDGNSMVLVTLDIDALHESFLRSFIKKTPSQFRIFWKKMAFSGKGATPRSMATEDEVIAFVTKTEGAVGYVSADKAKTSGCKVLAQPGEGQGE